MASLGYKDVPYTREQSVVRTLIDKWDQSQRDKKAAETVELVNGIIHQLEKAKLSDQWKWKCLKIDDKEAWTVDTGASVIFVPIGMKKRLTRWKDIKDLHVKVADGKLVRILVKATLAVFVVESSKDCTTSWFPSVSCTRATVVLHRAKITRSW